MNRSPDMSRTEREAEERLEATDRPPADAELGADWRLRQELRGLGAPALPPALRARIVRATARPARPAWWLGVAATIVLGLAVGLIWQSTGPEPQTPRVSDADIRELRLALATLEDSARRTSNITGRELAAGLVLPDLGELPYAPQILPWISPATPTHPQKES